jgi:CRISPR/Cas system-associated protein Cas10 (large subunit of type III CRISPR-Cas system)
MPKAKRPYTHQRCGVCRDLRDFKLLPNERDEYERSLMVCTRCNHKATAPGQVKQVWKPSQDGLS